MKIEERKKKTIPVSTKDCYEFPKARGFGHVTGARTSQMEISRLRRGTEGIELGFFDRLRQPDFLSNEKNRCKTLGFASLSHEQVCLYRLQSLQKELPGDFITSEIFFNKG